MGNPELTLPAAQALQQAVQYFQARRLAEAEALLREILQTHPEQADALHFLGLIAHQSGSSTEAAKLIRRALDSKPTAAMYCNLGIVLQALGDVPAAADNYRHAIQLSPTQAMPRHYLGTALAALGEMGQAVLCHSEAARLNPGFTAAHVALGNALHHLNRLNDAEAAYRRALDLPDDAATRGEVLNELAMVLLKMGRYDEAVISIKQALAIKPDSQLYQRNYRSLLARIIPPWHFSMLADHERNAAFRRAIERHCAGAELVLEIGTGSGLLAMMAARAGAGKVVTCEEIPALADNASRICAANGFDGRISVYATRSNNLRVGRELPARAQVLLAEILSSEILAEGAMDAMADAKARLLQDNAVIIPRAVTVCAALVASPALQQLTSVQTVEGFDLSLFNEFAPFLITVPKDAPYAVVSEAFFPFSLQMGERLAACVADFAVRVEKAATVHGVIQWMKVFLDEDNILENAPNAAGSDHWGAVFHPFPQAVEAATGQIINIRCEIDGTSLKMRVA
jgi:tetratricopeptide (TPR) repeat protein